MALTEAQVVQDSIGVPKRWMEGFDFVAGNGEVERESEGPADGGYASDDVGAINRA